MSAVFPATATEGTTGYLQAASPWTTGSFSVSFWFKKTALTSLRNYFTMGTLADADTYCVKITHAATTGTVDVGVGGAVASAGSSTITATSNLWDCDLGEWNHVAAVYTCTGTSVTAVKIVLNNNIAQASSGTITTRDLANASAVPAHIRFGVDFTGLSGINAKIAHPAMFSKELSDAEIGQLYLYKPPVISTGRLAYYEFGSGSLLADSWGSATLVDPGTSSVTYDADEPSITTYSGSTGRNLLLGVG